MEDKTDKDIQTWNANMVKDFRKLSNRINIYDRWLDKYVEYIKAARFPIIDLGCGIGNDTLYIKSYGKEIISVDYSDEALRIVNENIKGANTLKMNFENEWLFERESADLIIANLSLHYFDEKTTLDIIEKIKDTLIDGGILLARLNSIEDINYGSNSLDEIEKHYYNSMNIKKRFFDKNDIEYFFNSFKIEICREETVLTAVHDKPKKVWECAFKKQQNNGADPNE